MKPRLIFIALAIALTLLSQVARSATVAEILNGMRSNLQHQNAEAVSASAKFIIPGSGVIHIDATGGAIAVSQNDLPADVTLTMSLEDFENMMSGNLNAQEAFMVGRIRVEGDLTAIMRMQILFSQ